MLTTEDEAPKRQWQLLLIYSFYRISCVFFFLIFFIFSPAPRSFQIPYISLLFFYFILSLFFIICCKKHYPMFKTQVLFSGVLDIVVTTVLISFIGDMRSGFVILLNVMVAALSILVPGRLAIFFAAIASCMILGISFVEYLYDKTHTLFFLYSSGMHGAALFATALTAWYLAHRVRISESIAYHRGNELASMQRINEYIVERLHSGVIYVDSNRQIKLINTAAKHFFNAKHDVPYTNLGQLSAALDEKCALFLKRIRSDVRPVQAMLESPYLRVYFFSSSFEGQTAILIFLEDMSSVAQQAQQLKLAALGRLSASIAHELRNPLGAIFHAAQLLGETKPLNDDDFRLKQLIIKNCNRMNGVIKNILQLSRREQSHPELIEFFSFMTQFKHDFSLHNQCDIIVEPSSPSIFFIFDKSQLEQIGVILCDNALQHGRDAEGRVHIKISIKQNAVLTELRFSDNGPGVAAELKENIFEPFFTTVLAGSGMGLFIAKDLCEINQAQLALIPTEQGSCFTITINQVSEITL